MHGIRGRRKVYRSVAPKTSSSGRLLWREADEVVVDNGSSAELPVRGEGGMVGGGVDALEEGAVEGMIGQQRRRRRRRSNDLFDLFFFCIYYRFFCFFICHYNRFRCIHIRGIGVQEKKRKRGEGKEKHTRMCERT